MKVVIPKENWVDWLNHPVTKQLQVILKDKILEDRVNLSRGIGRVEPTDLVFRAGVLFGMEYLSDFPKLLDYDVKEDDKDEA